MIHVLRRMLFIVTELDAGDIATVPRDRVTRRHTYARAATHPHTTHTHDTLHTHTHTRHCTREHTTHLCEPSLSTKLPKIYIQSLFFTFQTNLYFCFSYYCFYLIVPSLARLDELQYCVGRWRLYSMESRIPLCCKHAMCANLYLP